MAVFKFSNVSGFKNYQRYNDFLAGNPAVQLDKGSMFPLGVFTLSANQTVVTFDNIPQTYTHLQIRALTRTTRATTTGDFWLMRFNGDTTSSYFYNHNLLGDGTSALANQSGAGTGIYVERVASANLNTNVFAGTVLDILDYRNTNKNKTIRHLSGYDNNSATNVGQIYFGSGLWMKTNAISSIEIRSGTSSDFVTNSTFALYGINA